MNFVCTVDKKGIQTFHELVLWLQRDLWWIDGFSCYKVNELFEQQILFLFDHLVDMKTQVNTAHMVTLFADYVLQLVFGCSLLCVYVLAILSRIYLHLAHTCHIDQSAFHQVDGSTAYVHTFVSLQASWKSNKRHSFISFCLGLSKEFSYRLLKNGQS